MRTRKRGFTLIELLVVIAIIAILAAILFPVYARMKEKAIRTLCLSNCKQLGTAFQAYVDDNDGRYPGDGMVGAPAGWIIAPAHYDLHVDTGALFPYVKNRDLYVCPLQRKKNRDIKLSYTMNHRLDWFAQSGIRSPSGCLVLIEEHENTALEENGPNDGSFVEWLGQDRPADRHGGGGNHTFADGHGKWVPFPKLRFAGPSGEVNDQRYFDPSLNPPQL